MARFFNDYRDFQPHYLSRVPPGHLTHRVGLERALGYLVIALANPTPDTLLAIPVRMIRSPATAGSLVQRLLA